jgi:acetolactate synthase I/II/III large subunit
MPTYTGAEYLARTLDAYGVTAVFHVPCILTRTLYQLECHTPIKRIVTHGEKASAYMADGYARATGRPGVCLAQNVGGANLAAGLKDPFHGCSPVVALTGGSYVWSNDRNFYQESDNPSMFRPLTKFSARVPDVTRLPHLLAHAFWTATAGKPGPTHLEVEGHAGEVFEIQEFDAVIPSTPPYRVPASRTAPTDPDVHAVAELIRRAKRPVIVAGGGVRSSGAGPELIALAEQLTIPIATALNAKDTVPGNHPLNVGVPGLYTRPSANRLILEADLVFFVGSQTGSQVTLSWQVPPPSAKVIQLDLEASELGRNYPGATTMQCDAKAGLTRLLAATAHDANSDREGWLDRAAELARQWREEVRDLVESDKSPVRPERLCAELSRHMPSDALLVSDTGHSGMWTGGYLDLNSPQQNYIRAAGSLGWGLPAGLGAQLALPDRQVIVFTGDGGLWYHLSELETAARWNIPAVIVVNNNRSLNQETDVYTKSYGGELHGRHAELWQFNDVDLAAVAESLGVRGMTVKKPQEFGETLARAVETNGPVLIDVVTDIEALAPTGDQLLAPAQGKP